MDLSARHMQMTTEFEGFILHVQSLFPRSIIVRLGFNISKLASLLLWTFPVIYNMTNMHAGKARLHPFHA